MPVQPPVYPNLPLRKLKTTTALPGGLLLMALAISHAAQGAEPAPNPPIPQQTNYQIRSQTLDTALVEFSLKSGLQVIADGKLTAGVKSPGVSGRYSPEQALQKLLAGTGVAVQTSRNGTVALKKAAAIEPQSGGTMLKAMTVVGEAVQDPNDPFNESYTVTNSSTATKTDTPIMDTPTSIQVVPRSVMEDQKASTVTEALENVSGVRAQPSLGLVNNIIIRGFKNQNIYRNGLKSNDDFPFQFDTANLQSVEVISV
jgi:iron complex outermembrane receptor protein